MTTDNQIKDAAQQAATEAEPELNQIAQAIILRHNLEQIKLNPTDLARIGLAFYEIQTQSFTLGVRMGMKLLVDVMREQTQCESV